MDYKIVEKEAFKVIGVSRIFKYEEAENKVPDFWMEHYQTGKGNAVCGMYGISIDEQMSGEEFEYIIADDFDSDKELQDGFIVKTIPKHTWAVFSIKGELPKSLQDVNHKIFSEWLPNNRDYEIAAGYNIEMYTNVMDYPKGNKDENYYCEMWIPVKKQ